LFINFVFYLKTEGRELTALENVHLKNDLADLNLCKLTMSKEYGRRKIMIMLHDGVVEDHIAELIASEMKNVRWKFDYPSNKGIMNLDIGMFFVEKMDNK
jgi:hypothetical protein